MNKAAQDYNSQGLELVSDGRHKAALDFFTKAIKEDPDFLEAYKNRGEALIKLNRFAEGEKDLQKAEGPKTKKTVKPVQKQKKAVAKYNLNEAEDLFGTLLTEERSEPDDDLFLDDFLYDDTSSGDASPEEQVYDTVEEPYGYDDLLYDDSYTDDAPGDEEVYETDGGHYEEDATLQDETFSDDLAEDDQFVEETAPEPPETENYSAILEYIGGLRQEVDHARLFEPLENSILLIDEETNDEQVVFFDQLTCLRVQSLPTGIAGKRNGPRTKEIITTVDGTVYRELVLSEQVLDNLLICLSADDQTPFTFTLFPVSNIKKRTPDESLIDILAEKRLISRIMHQRALEEYEQLKSMTLEKIVAQNANIPLAEIEEALDQARQNQMQGLQKEEILLFSGLANEEIILDAVERLEHINKLKIGQFLIDKGIVQEREVYIALAEKHKIPFVDLTGRKLSKKSLTSLPQNLIEDHEILPLAMKDDILLVATHFVDMSHLHEVIIKAADCKDVKFVLSPPTDIKKIIHLVFGRNK